MINRILEFIKGKRIAHPELREGYNEISRSIPKKVERLEERYSFDFRQISMSGCYGRVYPVDEGVVGKVLHSFDGLNGGEKAFRDISKEYCVQKLAFQSGIYVPEPYGIFLARDSASQERYPMLAMRDLGRAVLEDVLENKDVESELAHESWEKEVEKVRTRMLREYDSWADFHHGNAIWAPEEGQTYLIDCAIWEL